MNLLRHRRERLAVRAEIKTLVQRLEDALVANAILDAENNRLRAELDQAEAELRALRGEVA
jgi:regulator of replication initiation timing